MEDYDAIFKGDYSHLPPKQSNVARIFLSSTFGDFITERNELMRNTFPRLRAYCQSNDLEFQVVDMRWGVRDENISYHQTSDICVQEIQNCQRLSLGPSFIALLGNRYGYRPFPAKIPVTEFSMFTELAATHEIDVSALSSWFKCDNNAIPPVYQLQPIITHFPHYTSRDAQLRQQDRDGWWETFLHLQNLFWKLVDLAVRANRITSQRAHVYLQSVTEDEINNGIFGLLAPNSHCLCYIREIEELHDNISEAIACRYVDSDPFNPTRVDECAQQLLKELKEQKLPVALHQSNLQKFSIPWSSGSGGVNPNVPEHEKYLESLCKQVYADVKRLVDEALVSKDFKTTELHHEILHHATFCMSKCESFCGREELLSNIKEYLASEKQKPLVIYGPSGSGKTTIMAKSMSLSRGWMGQGCVSVVRFLGTSPASSNIREVLVSICSQICIAYDMQVPNFSEMDTLQIARFFCNQFLESLQSYACGNNHLCIFLDSIDQLSSLDGAHSLHWLPKSLPSNMHIVVSMLPEKHDCLKTLQTMLSSDDCYIQVGVLPLHTGLEIMDAWLTKGNRTISVNQREVVSKAFLSNPQPLYLRLLFHHTQRWNSYTDTSDINVATSTLKAIQQFFTNLEDQYGRTLVRRALGCITAAKSGLTETELEDVLSLDNEVLNEIYQYWDPPDQGLLRLPALLWKRIRYELSDYLVEQHADGKTVFAWYHRQFIESAKAIYLNDEGARLSIHQALSEFFEGTWSGKECKPIILVHRNLNLDANRQVAPQPIQFSKKVYNIRKLNELPYHLLLSKQLEKLKTIALCNFHWLHTKITITSFQTVMQDFSLSIAHTDDSDIPTIGEALSLSASNLMSDPDSLAGQLLGRLNSFKVQSQHVHTLIEEAHHWAVELSEKHQLIPHNNCLISPGGPLKTTLLAHPHLILALSITKFNGSLLMISSSKGTHCSIFNIWDICHLPQYVQNLHTLKIADSGIPQFCSVNEFLIGASGQTVTAWNCVTGEKVFTVRTLHSVTSLTTTRGGQYLIVGMANGSILSYDKLSGNSYESHTHQGSIDYMASLEKGSIVTASRNGWVGVYDTNLHKHLHVLQAHNSTIICMTSASRSGKSYVLTGSDDKTAKVWIVASEKVQLLHTLAGHTKTIRCITYVHADMDLAITGSLDKTIRIWDAILIGTCLRILEGHLDGVWCLAILSDGLRLVSGSKDDYLKVWDISTGECLHTLEGHSSWVSCVVVPCTKDNNIIVSGSNDKNIKIWKLGSAKSLPTDRHFAQPECILSTSSGLVVSGAPDAIKVWDSASARCLHTFSTPASCLCTTDDGSYLISGSKDSTINIWNLKSFSRVRTVSNQYGATTCLVMVDTNAYLSSHADGMLALRYLYTDNCKIMSGHTGSIKCMLASKDRCIAASGSYDCAIRVWNIVTADCVATLTGHDKVVWSIALSSDSSLLASGSDDSTVRIWSIVENCCLHHIACPENVKCVAFGLKDKVVIAGAHCSQNQLRAWDSTMGECVSNYKGHTHAVMCIKIVDECTAITGSRDGTIRVWNITTGELFATFDLQSQVKHIAIMPKSVDKHQVSLAATTKTGPIALLDYHYP